MSVESSSESGGGGGGSAAVGGGGMLQPASAVAAGKVSLKIKSRYNLGLSGMIMKQGHRVSNWKRRYFILDFENEALRYYDVPSNGDAPSSRNIKIDKEKMFKGGYKLDKASIIVGEDRIKDGKDTYEFVFKVTSKQIDAQDVILNSGKQETLCMSIGVLQDPMESEVWSKFQEACAAQSLIDAKFRDWLRDSDNFLASGKDSVKTDAIIANIIKSPSIDSLYSAKKIKEVLVKLRTMYLEREVWIEAITDCSRGGYREVDTPSLWPGKFRPNVPISVKIANKLMTDVTFISPALCMSKPDVVWTRRNVAKSGKDEEMPIYSVCMIDADNITSSPPSRCHYIHWLVCNITQQSILLGNTVLSYVPPMPFYNSGPHRYYFVAFEQTKALTDPQILELKNQVNSRNCNLNAFAATHLNSPYPPCGLAGFFAQWEESVDKLHATYNYIPLTDFLSPAQKKANSDRKTIEFMEKSKLETCTKYKLSDVANVKELLELPASSTGGQQKPMKMVVKFDKSSTPSTTFFMDSSPRDGDVIANSLATTAPKVSFRDVITDFAQGIYTIIALDPDMPALSGGSSTIIPTEYIVWFVVNIPGEDIEKGRTILSYQWPEEIPKKATNDRFVFLLYKQATPIPPEELGKVESLVSQRTSVAWHSGIKASLASPYPLSVRVFYILAQGFNKVAPINNLEDLTYLSSYRAFAGNDALWGAVMQKKLSSDFNFKDRFIGISIKHKAIYWHKDLSRQPYIKDSDKMIEVKHVTVVAVYETNANESHFVLTINDPAQPNVKDLQLKLTSSNARADSEIFKAMILILKKTP